MDHINIDSAPIAAQSQLLIIETGSAVLAFATLELRLMMFFEQLLGIPQFKVSTAVWEGMIFRDKITTTNKLVSIRVESPKILTVWNGIKAQPPEQGLKGVFGHLQKASEKRNKLVHSTPVTRHEAGKPSIVSLQPSLFSSDGYIEIKDIQEMRAYFDEVTLALDWLATCEMSYEKDGVRHPIPEKPRPNMVATLLHKAAQI